MNQLSFELPLVCLIPSLVLFGYVLYKDRLEPEPVGLLAILLAAGLACGVAGFNCQRWVVGFLDGLFEGHIEMMADGLMVYSSESVELLHHLLCAFLGTAFLQITLKWLALFLLTHRCKAFNHLYDGIVYATVLSMGYALAECAMYGAFNGFTLLNAKLLTAIPAHLFVGILMGWFYTMWRGRFLANVVEAKLLRSGLVQQDRIRTSAPWLLMSAIVPMVVDTLYCLVAFWQGSVLTTLFVTAVFVLYGISFIVIDRLAGLDISCKRYLVRVIANGHPELDVGLLESIVETGAVEVPDEKA